MEGLITGIEASPPAPLRRERGERQQGRRNFQFSIFNFQLNKGRGEKARENRRNF
jgi:hypothetical protein